MRTGEYCAQQLSCSGQNIECSTPSGSQALHVLAGSARIHVSVAAIMVPDLPCIALSTADSDAEALWRLVQASIFHCLQALPHSMELLNMQISQDCNLSGLDVSKQFMG